MINNIIMSHTFIPHPDYQPFQPQAPKQAPQLTVQELNAWLQKNHAPTVEAFASHGLRLNFHQYMPHHPIALRVSSDNASFAFAVPTPVPLRKHMYAEPLVEGAAQRLPQMAQAFAAYDRAYEDIPKHQRPHIQVPHGTLEDRQGWQLQPDGCERLSNWRTCTRTSASLEGSVLSWCEAQSALRQATNKDYLVQAFQDPKLAVHNANAPALPNLPGTTSAFELPALSTDQYAFRVYLAGANDANGNVQISAHVRMCNRQDENHLGTAISPTTSVELRATGVQFSQGLASATPQSLQAEDLGLEPGVASFFIDTQMPMVQMLPQHQQAQESYDYTQGLDMDMSTQNYDFSR